MPPKASPKRHYQRWTPAEIKQLRRLAKQRVPTAKIAKEFKRSVQSVYQKASMEDIALGGGRGR